MQTPGFRDGKIIQTGLAASITVAALAISGCSSHKKVDAAPTPVQSANVSQAIGGSCLAGYETQGYARSPSSRSIKYMPITETPRTGTSVVILNIISAGDSVVFDAHLAGEPVDDRNLPLNASVSSVELQFSGNVTAAQLPAITANANTGLYDSQLAPLQEACDAIFDPAHPVR